MPKPKKAKKKVSVKTIAKKLLKLFGPGGKHWASGDMFVGKNGRSTYFDDDGNYIEVTKDNAYGFCLLGGLEKLDLPSEPLRKMLPLYADYDGHAQYTNIPNFNDDDGWKPIRKFLKMLAEGKDTTKVIITEDGKAIKPPKEEEEEYA
jgi:hypothetical protein